MNRLFPLFAFIFLTVVVSCNKKNSGDHEVTPINNNMHQAGARLSGPNYSQSINQDLANNMITSYTASVSFPYRDTALRSQTLNADSLRSYLSNPEIVTLRFVMAHQPSYMQYAYGKYAGVKASALTMVVTGMNENNVTVRTKYNGFYHNNQPVSIEQSNQMIQSYLTSVNYPYADTALRALSFDADTLRSYLVNPEIKNLMFVMAHQPSYAQNAYGKYVGMTPAAQTMVIIGLDVNGVMVKNSSNGFYEHFDPCPISCPGQATDALLH